MKRRILSLAVLLGLTSASAIASDNLDSSSTYLHEANVTFNTDTDNFDDGLWSLDYRFYFNPVDTNNGPYALNGFLAQISNLGAQYAQISVFDDTVSYSVDGSYVFDSKWFIGANYSKVDLDNGDAYVISLVDDMSEYGFNLGYYFNETSEVSFAYQTGSSSGNYSVEVGDDIYSTSLGSDSKRYTAQIHSFVPLQSFSGLDLLANWSYIDSGYKHIDTTTNQINTIVYENSSQVDTNMVTLAADWYITKSWSVGANYLWNQYDMEGVYITPDGLNTFSGDDNNSFYSLSTSYWWQISQSFAANFNAAKQFGLDGDNTPDGFLIGITANARF